MSTTSPNTMPDGFYVTDEFLQFATALNEAGGFAGDTDHLLYFIEKPWKWCDEYQLWSKVGRPTDASEPGWDAFQSAVDAK